MPTCAACGQDNPEGFRFCGSCGAELAPAATRREVRKTVTVVFCDVTGSTALGERLDPEALRRTMGRYFEEIRRIVERHGGNVEKFIGDAVMAVFGIPVAHEDDALRAVRAVSEIRERLGALGAELSVSLSFRTGVNTGEVVAGEGETLVTGDAVNVAARLEQAATPGEILIGAETLSLVRGAVTVEAVEPLELKGKRDAVAAYRLVDMDVTADAFARHLDAPLVGRIRELQRLRAEFDVVISERTCHLFTLLGPAGAGKSRLVAEFLAGAADSADMLHSRCLHYGEDITYWPLVEVLVGIGVDPAEVIDVSPADTQLAFRKLLEARALRRPQIVLLDDLQWAEPVFLDLVEHIADLSRDAPILLLCVARPELLELRPGWGGGKLNATTILLEALSPEDCETLISRLAGDDRLTESVRGRILATASGNPLFIEEMLALVNEEGGNGDVVVPPTIHALLQARLDRLPGAERDVIGRGSVEGQVFHRGTVRELAPETESAEVGANLVSLVRKEVIRPDQPMFPDDEAYRFRHLLIRDAAYDSLPKETRADLHERFAEWLERHPALVEQDEIVGYHLESAHRNRAELDGADPRLEDLARRAAARLRAAANSATARGDHAAVAGLLHRAVALLPEGDLERLEALIVLGDPLATGVRAERALEIAAELAASPDPRFQAYGAMVETWAEVWGNEWLEERAIPRVEAAAVVFRAHGDELGLALVERHEWYRHWVALRLGPAALAAARGAAHARSAGDDAIANDLLERSRNYHYDMSPVDDTLLDTAQAHLDEANGTVARGVSRRRLAQVLAIRGAFDAARAHVYAGAAESREAGLLIEAAGAGMVIAAVELRAGDAEKAESVLRDALEELERVRGLSFYPTTALQLAELLALRGAYDEAAHWCAIARDRMADDDIVDVIRANAVEGFLAAVRGDHVEAERLALYALEASAPIDGYAWKAGSHQWAARTFELIGKPREAREHAAKALEIYETKGDVAAIAWTRELLASLSA